MKKKAQNHFSNLSPAEQERLAILAEECGEVVQIVGKILRHGYESSHPNDPLRVTNRQHLEKELGDIQWIMAKMIAAKDMDIDSIAKNSRTKEDKTKPYLHHN